MRVFVLLSLSGVALAAMTSCAPCSKDDLEPNDSAKDAADGGDLNKNVNEVDLNFHDQTDVDCVSYAVPEPLAADGPIGYVELHGADREDVDLEVTLSCGSGDSPTLFHCNGDVATEPVCSAATGPEAKLSFSYDCDAADNETLGAATLVVCMSRPSPEKLCTDYSLRAFLN